MMKRLSFSPVLLIALSIQCYGQEASEATGTNREGPMRIMQERTSELDTTGLSEKLSFGQEPILRYNDVPRGIVDASVWRLGKDGRPRAVLVLEIYNGRSIQYEFTAVADPPKQVRVTGWNWSPGKSDYAWVTIPVKEVPKEKRLRKRQIKQLSRAFTASEEYRGQTHHLRLMPHPVYEYSDPDRGVLEGAVFAWAHGTNVEILMFLESRQMKDAQPYWCAGFSRLGSASLTVNFQEQDFWSSPSVTRPTQSDSYYYRMDTLRPEERASITAE